MAAGEPRPTNVANDRVDTPLGDVLCAVTDGRLVRVELPGGDDERFAVALRRDVGPVVADQEATAGVRAELEAYFAGELETFATPLDWRLADPFARRVLEALRAVPYGTTVTYGELARRTGHVGGARAVGRALATNPLPIVVPCHRVLGADQRLTGFSGAAHRVDQKAFLLALEGASLPINTL